MLFLMSVAVQLCAKSKISSVELSFNALGADPGNPEHLNEHAHPWDDAWTSYPSQVLARYVWDFDRSPIPGLSLLL